MNDYRQVRDYINTRMAIVEPTFQEWTGSLSDIGNIPKTLLDKSYHITLGTATSSPQVDKHVEDDVAVTIEIFRRGFNDSVNARDEVMQTANCIRLDLINPLNFEEYKELNTANIEDVQSVSLTPLEIDLSNDNVIRVEIGLNVRLFFGTT